jgi:hypothetical protein
LDEEEDVCTILSDIELAEAFHLTRLSGRSSLRLLISEKVPDSLSKDIEPTIEECNSQTSARANVTANIATHSGINCDICQEKPITGIRFKCRVCPDFDLCSDCEAKNLHPTDHPLLKMRVPEVALHTRDVHHNVKCDGCHAMPIVGPRFKCTCCQNFDLCFTCEAKDLHPADHPLLKIMSPSTVKTSPHPLCRGIGLKAKILTAMLVVKVLPWWLLLSLGLLAIAVLRFRGCLRRKRKYMYMCVLFGFIFRFLPWWLLCLLSFGLGCCSRPRRVFSFLLQGVYKLCRGRRKHGKPSSAQAGPEPADIKVTQATQRFLSMIKSTECEDLLLAVANKVDHMVAHCFS